LPKSYVRLTHPLVRDTRGGELRQATWDEALDRTVAGLQAALAKRASDAVRAPIGIFSCSKATNEVNFLAQKFTRVAIGTNNIDSCNRT
jgi:predicted molibdopterin-dependent oxidoreductase YjgC